jgi:hypothetical protein
MIDNIRANPLAVFQNRPIAPEVTYPGVRLLRQALIARLRAKKWGNKY